MYTVIESSKEQAQALFEKHIKPTFFGIISKKLKSTFSYDSEDDVGFFSANLLGGKRVSCQVRGSSICFVEFTGFGNIRYDISYPNQLCPEMSEVITKWALEAKDNFWKGGEI